MKLNIIKIPTVIIMIISMFFACACQDTKTSSKQGNDRSDESGSYIIFEPDTTENVTDENIDAVISVLQSRLDSNGIYTAEVTKKSNNRIVVEIPGIDNPEEAISLLGSTAKLEFVDKDGKVILSGDDVVDACETYESFDSTQTKSHMIRLELSDEGALKFADATERISQYTPGKNYIAIQLDGNIISMPSVNEKIETTECIISGDFDEKSAKHLATLIQSGQLPFSLNCIESGKIN